MTLNLNTGNTKASYSTVDMQSKHNNKILLAMSWWIHSS